MPVAPSDLADPREIAATNQVEQKVVALDEASGAACVHLTSERPLLAFVAPDGDARERHPVLEIHPYATTFLLDLTQTMLAPVAGIQLRQVVAQAATSAATPSLSAS